MPWTLLLALSAPAHAGQAIYIRTMTSVSHGQQAPYVEFEIHEPGQIKAQMTCSGKSWSLDQRVGHDQTLRLELTGIAAGAHDCTGQMTFVLDRGEELTQGLDLSVASVAPVEWNLSYDKDYDRAGKQFTAHADRPISQAAASYVGAYGKQVDYAEADLSDPSNPVFRWTTDEPIVKVEVEAIDEHQFKSLLEVFPYWYNIPHEDPVFDSGSHAVNASEGPKLADTWGKIGEQFELYGGVIQMDLYVAGYTDTQGDAGSNQGLSERRARSIAQWFRNQGFQGAIYYQGFGESALAVETGDGVDEVRNRRVVYFLANQPPPPGPDVPRSNWRKL